MKKACAEYRTQLLEAWESQGSIDSLSEQSPHPTVCDDCRKYTAEFDRFAHTLQEAAEVSLSEPDFVRMRVNTWDRIERSERKSWFPEIALQPAIIAPLVALLIALGTWWFVSKDTTTPAVDEFTELSVSDVAWELDPSYLPEESLNLILREDMALSVYEYFIEHEAYDQVAGSFPSEETWNEVLAAVEKYAM